MPTITLPHKFAPRDYQVPLLKALDEGYTRAIGIWHRRSGKDKTVINYIAKRMMEKVGTYYYFFPTYNQGRKILWDGIDRDGFKFTDHFPKELRTRTDNTQMLIQYRHPTKKETDGKPSPGSIFQIIGTDNIDSIVGTNPIGCVFSEYSVQDPRAWDYIRPILAENKGFAIFIYTPRGKNHGYNLLQFAKDDPTWFTQVLTVEDTNAISEKVLEQEKKEIIAKNGNEALFMQEYYCSFDVPIEGAYYGKQLMEAEEEGRITNVPYDPDFKVHTAWDLGVGDATSIWFYQEIGKELRVIDFYEQDGEALSHYVKVLTEKPYVYGDHYAPHDIETREFTTGKARIDVARQLGIHFRVVPKLSVDDGINAVRSILNKCWFDKDKCETGLSALRSYKKEFDEKKETYRDRPVHDWASHAADSFRYLAVGHRPKMEIKAPVDKTKWQIG